MTKGQWLTPDAPAAGYICREIHIPNSIAFAAIVDGCLLQLTRAYNFEQVGTLTPSEVASLFATMFDDYVLRNVCMTIPVGTVVSYCGTDIAPAGWLYCDGSIISRATYAALFQAIGVLWGAGDGSTTFQLPDLRQKFAVGAQSGVSGYGLSQGGGAASVVLSVGMLPFHQHSIPDHSHSEITATATLINGGLEAPASSAVPGVGTTGSASLITNGVGSGQAHENRPPYRAMYPIIKY